MHPTVERVYHAIETRMRDDPVAFVERLVRIEDKDADEIVIPFRLWDEQRDALKSIHAHRLNIVLKARQLGITWLALAYAVYVLRMREGSTVVALSRTEDEAKELIRRATVILRNMPELVRADEWGGATWSGNALSVTIAFANGKNSFMKAFPAAVGASRSFTANLVLLDEWAFQQYAREIWEAAYPTINRPTGGKVIGLSTIKRGTLFEELWLGDNDFNKIFIPWMADPRRTAEWYEKTQRAMGDAILSEYPATPDEALSNPGGAFFPEVRAHIHKTDAMPAGMVERYISIDYGLDALAALWHAVDAEGNDTVYRELYRSGLIVSEAAQMIRQASGREEIRAVYAPPDLWNRNRDTGRSTAEIFSANGVYLNKVSNDRIQGWLDVKEWLSPVTVRDTHTGEARATARLRILDAPNLWRCLLNIQRDERRPNDCATEPHELTHLTDSLRYFCSGRPCAPELIVEDDDDAPSWNEQLGSFVDYGRK